MTTVGSLILRNRFLQIALKLLDTLLCNFAACNHIEIVKSGYNLRDGKSFFHNDSDQYICQWAKTS